MDKRDKKIDSLKGDLNNLRDGFESGSSGGTGIKGLADLCSALKGARYDTEEASLSAKRFCEANGYGGDAPVTPPDVTPEEPTITLSSISAIYNGGDVAVGTALTNLTGITVTATYSDGNTATVTGYTLSGEIAEGENTITVSYDGKTTTFTVTGVAEPDGVAVAMTAPVQHVNMENIGYYSDGGETKYSDARFPCTNGKTMLSEKVFESDTTLKITVAPTANTFQCYLFCSTLLDGERILSRDTDDLFYYIKSSSEVLAYGWSKEKHEFEYTVKAGYKFGIIGVSASGMDADIITVEVV